MARQLRSEFGIGGGGGGGRGVGRGGSRGGRGGRGGGNLGRSQPQTALRGKSSPEPSSLWMLQNADTLSSRSL